MNDLADEENKDRDKTHTQRQIDQLGKEGEEQEGGGEEQEGGVTQHTQNTNKPQQQPNKDR